jgi:hypothetical protein
MAHTHEPDENIPFLTPGELFPKTSAIELPVMLSFWRQIMTKHYVYGTRLDSKLKKGAPYAYVGDGGFKVVDGEILEVDPAKRLVMSWNAH